MIAIDNTSLPLNEKLGFTLGNVKAPEGQTWNTMGQAGMKENNTERLGRLRNNLVVIMQDNREKNL
jgi:hypothetical protein